MTEGSSETPQEDEKEDEDYRKMGGHSYVDEADLPERFEEYENSEPEEIEIVIYQPKTDDEI